MANGIVTDIKTKEDVAKAKDVLGEIGENLTEASGELTEANHGLEDAGNDVRDTREDVSELSGERAYARSQARSKDEQAKASAKAVEDNKHKWFEEFGRLRVERERIARQEELAHFQKRMYARKVYEFFEEGKQELEAEQQIRDGEIVKSIKTAFRKLDTAITGEGQSSGSAEPVFPNYYQGKTPPQDESEYTFASVHASKKSLEANEAYVTEQMNDPYFANKAVADAAESSAANAEYSSAEGAFAAAKSAEKAALTSWESARLAVDKVQADVDEVKQEYTKQADQFDIAQAYWRDQSNKQG